MRNLALTICALAALTAAAPVPAQPQTATAFDGTYRGVSRQLEGAAFGGTTRACPVTIGHRRRSGSSMASLVPVTEIMEAP